MALFTKEESLAYHEEPRPGKLEVLPVKPCFTQKDLSMAYSPGVANACLAIADDPSLANAYTGRGNLVAVVSPPGESRSWKARACSSRRSRT